MTNENTAGTIEGGKFNVILAPTEGADTERSAISVAVKLAKKQGAVLHLVRVEATPYRIEPIGRHSSFAPDGGLHDDRLVNRDELELLAAACKAAAKIRVVSAFEKGPVGRTLADYARKSEADLIVMASHSRMAHRHTALGSITEYLIRRSNIPVLVVKGRPAFVGPTDAESFSTIVVPLDGSELAESILPATKKLARMLHSRINLVHVLTPGMYSQQQTAEAVLPWWETDIGTARDYLDRIAADLVESGLTVTTDVLLSDDIVTTILEHAAHLSADIIAIATSGAGGMSRFVFGSVADELTRRSPISLFAMHEVHGRSEMERAAQASLRAGAGA
jgi:nucleotide-binding universal stress UspA family protein